MLYRTNAALLIKGDRLEKGTEIELSRGEASRFDPADITPVADIPEEEPELELATVPLEEMDHKQLQARAKELGLSAGGSKADLQERITLHLENPPEDSSPDSSQGEEENLPDTN